MITNHFFNLDLIYFFKGILSSPVSFVTPSQSSSVPVSVSPQLTHSPPQSPFLISNQDEVAINNSSKSIKTSISNNKRSDNNRNRGNSHFSRSDNNHINTTQDQDLRRCVTPNRRPSLTQVSTSPSAAGTVVFRPSPTQSPAHIPGQPSQHHQYHHQQQQGNSINATSPAGHEFNTTLVGSNNISLNKRGNKRNNLSVNVGYHTGHGVTSVSSSGSGPKTAKKVSSQQMISSPIASPTPSMRPPTPQPVIQQVCRLS